MLSQRYLNDGKSVLRLTESQLQAKIEIEKKIKGKTYVFEDVECPICGNSDKFTILGEKDRYGLFCQTVACPTCGLLLTNPRMNEFSYVQFYNKEYRWLYTDSVDSTESFFLDQYRHGGRIIKYIQKHTPIKSFSGKYVVEIGCGAGGILKAMRDNGAIVQGLDLGEAYLTYGKEKYSLSLDYGSICDFDFKVIPDVIIYSHVLEHILDINCELNRIKEISGENTLVYVEVPGLKNIHNTYAGDFLLYLQNAHTYHFSLKSLKSLFSKHGFKIVIGDEYVKCIFGVGGTNSGINNVYSEELDYLNWVEKYRWYYNIKNKVYLLLKKIYRSVVKR